MRFIACDEDSQIYSFSRSNKKSSHVDLNTTKTKYQSNGFKKLKENKRNRPT